MWKSAAGLELPTTELAGVEVAKTESGDNTRGLLQSSGGGTMD